MACHDTWRDRFSVLPPRLVLSMGRVSVIASMAGLFANMFDKMSLKEANAKVSPGSDSWLLL
jgi:hypothetical protein